MHKREREPMMEHPFPALVACDKADRPGLYTLTQSLRSLRTLISFGPQANTSEFQESGFLESQSPRDTDQEELCSCVETRGS